MKSMMRRLLFASTFLIAALLLTSIAGAQDLTCAPTDPPTGCAVVTLNPAGLIGDFYIDETPIIGAVPAAALSVPAALNQKINVRNIQSAEAGFGSLFVYNDASVTVYVAGNTLRPYTVSPTKRYIRGTLVLTCDIRTAVGAAVFCQVTIDGIPQPDLLAAGAKGTYILDPGNHTVDVTLVGDQAAMWHPAVKTLTTTINASATPRLLTASFDKKALVTITLSVPTAVADLYVDGALVATQVATHQLYVAPGNHKFEAKNIVDPAAAGVYRWKDATLNSYLYANTTRTVKITPQKEFLLGFLAVTCQLRGLQAGQTGHCLPTIDGVLMPQIENGKTTTFTLAPGPHQLSVDAGPETQFGNPPLTSTPTIRAGQTTRYTARISVLPVYDPYARHTTGLPDDITGKQIRFIYVIPKDGIDHFHDTSGALRTSIAAIQSYMAGQTGGRTFRVDTYQGVPDVTFFQLSRTNAEMTYYGAYAVDFIAMELAKAGLFKPNSIHAVYYDGDNDEACGSAPLPGNIAATYLQGITIDPAYCEYPGFAPDPNTSRPIEWTMIHEILHATGVVPECAPNDDFGHIDDFNDMMYGGAGWPPFPVLDVNHDDYFMHNNPNCFDLDESGWLTP